MILRGFFFSFLISLPAPLLAKDTVAPHLHLEKVFVETYLDVLSGELKTNAIIEITGGRISAIKNGPKDAIEGDFLDLSGYTVLPGLIDAHTHLCDNSHLGADFDHWSLPAATFGIVGALNAKKTLRAGFTTVRDVSSPFYCDVALRDSISRGWVEGPRMFVSGQMVTMTGGHGSWGNWMAPEHEIQTNAHAIADGADEVRKAVRTHVRNKVDLIKVAATGGYGTHGTIPGAASYSVEELRVIVNESRKHGLTVAAHAHGADGIKNAVRAGVTSIEHASMIDDETIRLMRKNDTYAVLDLLSARFDLIERNQNYDDKNLGRTNNEEYDAITMLFKKTYEAGVKIAFGTDAGVYPHGRNAEQFQLMIDAGMSSLDAIRSATIIAADLLNQQENIGEIKVGKYADFIAVRGNPLEDIRVLEDVDLVIKEGVVISAQSE
ncbi:amidohydrolase family protein [Hyphococcus flavus]|uniref:Amidohydrolase family protein n=1 Tax=Hyphococcus flavus TaxID=1866326 RepID=A0AAF0CDP5_9PROT|nr:amidohydrolase family protein [Hyphococcus flavus]WDI30026.1 amidohydrolase family protein [Hyphococcus flavus]